MVSTWYFYGTTGTHEYGYSGERTGLLSGTSVNVGSTNGLASGDWGDTRLNSVDRAMIIYAYA